MNEITTVFLEEVATLPPDALERAAAAVDKIDRAWAAMCFRNNAAIRAMKPKQPMKRAQINRALLETVARGTVAPQLPRLHDASFQTVVLRSGLGLGLISPVNFGQARPAGRKA